MPRFGHIAGVNRVSGYRAVSVGAVCRRFTQVVLLVGLVAGCKGETEPGPAAASVIFEQISFVLPAGTPLVPYSEWAFAVVTAGPDSADRYVNVSVGDEWVIENMIVPAAATADDTVALAYSFALNRPRGDTVTSLDYGMIVTTEPLTAAPEPTDQSAVTQTRVTLTCSDGAPPKVPGGTRTRGGKKVPGSGARHNAPKTIPNQEAGQNECAPTAISNSLKWLNGRYNLGMADADISIDSMKAAGGWQPDGAPADWATRKDAHMQAKGLPIATTYTVSIEEARDAIKNGCDVELDLAGHVSVIVGMVQFEDGTWQIELREDLEQAARRRREEAHPVGKYDPASKAFTGRGYGPFTIDGFVIECKK